MLHERTAIFNLQELQNTQFEVHKPFEECQRLLTLFIYVRYYFHNKQVYYYF